MKKIIEKSIKWHLKQLVKEKSEGMRVLECSMIRDLFKDLEACDD